MIAVWCYWSGLFGGLFFDDSHVIRDNSLIRIESLDWNSLHSAANSFLAGGRQLSMLSFGLNFYFFGELIFAYKAINLALHLLTGFALFAATKMLISALSQSETNIADSNHAEVKWVPLLAASFWILYPINLSSVLYISQRMTILASLFIAIGIACYLFVRISNLANHKKLILIFVSTAVCTLFAYSSKENGILLPAYVLLIEVVVFQQWLSRIKNRWDGSHVFKVVVAVFLALAVFGAIEILSPFVIRQIDGYGGREFTLYERVLTQFRALNFYLSQILVPNNAELSMWHDDIKISKGLFQPVTTFVSILVILGLLFLAMGTASRNRIISLSILWFFLGHSLESTFIPLEMIHEHRNYFPSYGVALFISYLILSSKYLRREVAAVIVLAMLALNVGVLHARANIWSHEQIKAVHEANHHPDSPLAQFSMARYLYGAGIEGDSKAAELAEKVLVANINLDKTTVASEMLLILLSDQSHVEMQSSWIASAVQKIRDVGYNAITSRALAGLLEHLQKETSNLDPAQFDPIFEELANHSKPQFLTFAAIFNTEVRENYEKGFSLFEKAAQRSNNRPMFRLNLLRAQLKLRRFEGACESFEYLKSLPQKKTLMIQKEIGLAGEWLDGKCA